MARVAILNEHLGTLGGGERACFALASALAAAGHEVEVVTTEPGPPGPAAVAAAFGPGHDGFTIRAVPEARGQGDGALGELLRPYDVLVNHSAGSSLPNPCPLGVYAVMFPFQPGGPWVETYQHLLCNSLFTERHTRRRWGGAVPTRVLYPAAELLPAPGPKAREIVAVGRFAATGHHKNQPWLVEAFARLLPRAPSGWRLVLVGRVNADRPTLEELGDLAARCADLPVDLLLDAPEADRRAALDRAAVCWHATGALAPPHLPERQEHFGIAVVEAMSAGAVPVCFDGGGPREIVEHGWSGLLYQDQDGLARATAALLRDEARREAMGRRARERAERFGRPRFDAEVQALFAGVIAS
ncbi:MAG: glycosyltransferase family 4 protein [Anaeromyxobacter sp.]